MGGWGLTQRCAHARLEQQHIGGDVHPEEREVAVNGRGLAVDDRVAIGHHHAIQVLAVPAGRRTRSHQRHVELGGLRISLRQPCAGRQRARAAGAPQQLRVELLPHALAHVAKLGRQQVQREIGLGRHQAAGVHGPVPAAPWPRRRGLMPAPRCGWRRSSNAQAGNPPELLSYNSEIEVATGAAAALRWRPEKGELLRAPCRCVARQAEVAVLNRLRSWNFYGIPQRCTPERVASGCFVGRPDWTGPQWGKQVCGKSLTCPLSTGKASAALH